MSIPAFQRTNSGGKTARYNSSLGAIDNTLGKTPSVRSGPDIWKHDIDNFKSTTLDELYENKFFNLLAFHLISVRGYSGETIVKAGSIYAVTSIIVNGKEYRSAANSYEIPSRDVEE